ncbi:uncharacterized protein JCM15063_000946 [Sporobolomyces koalae]|uniref:uncharacterized protein n=1 Tax=Sporobolomyces koalae TaxID=500713 RepID=UPI003171BDAD
MQLSGLTTITLLTLLSSLPESIQALPLGPSSSSSTTSIAPASSPTRPPRPSLLSSNPRQGARKRSPFVQQGSAPESSARLFSQGQHQERPKQLQKRRSNKGDSDWEDSTSGSNDKWSSSNSKGDDDDEEDEEDGGSWDGDDWEDEEDSASSSKSTKNSKTKSSSASDSEPTASWVSLTDPRATSTSTSASSYPTTGNSSSGSETSTASSSSASATSTGKAFAASGSSSADCAVLSALYTSLGGASPGWVNMSGWSSGSSENCCSWYGVTCDANGRVSALDLASNGLSGPLDNRVFSLSSLNRLNMSSNALTGAIPDAFGTTPLLSTVYLDSNLFTGPLPPSFLASSSIQYLHLSNNSLSGSLAFTAATNLSVLDCARNQFDGQLDVSAHAGALTTVKLDYNKLAGNLPDLSTMPGLTSLSLKGNAFTGSVTGLGSVTNLEKFDISSNAFTGPYPDPSGLTRLITYSVAANAFTGPFPSSPAPPSLLTSIQANGCKIDAALPASGCPSDQVLADPKSLAAFCGVVCKGGGKTKSAVPAGAAAPITGQTGASMVPPGTNAMMDTGAGVGASAAGGAVNMIPPNSAQGGGMVMYSNAARGTPGRSRTMLVASILVVSFGVLF